MHKIILFHFSIIFISVIGNPVPQGISLQTCPYQQNSNCNQPFSVPLILQQCTGKRNPSNQAVTNQNPAQSQGNPLNDNINQIFVSKILSNPSLQKILDPNTKLYNQNGDEIKRQVPNTGVPNVINNYFIVPPEFLNLNETSLKKGAKPKQLIRARSDRVAKAKGKGKDDEINTNTEPKRAEMSNGATSGITAKKVENDNIPVDQSKNNKRKQIRENNNIQPKTESDVDNQDEEKRKPRRKKRKRKKEKQNPDVTSTEIVNSEISSKTKVDSIDESNKDQNTNTKKRRRRPRPKTNQENEYHEFADTAFVEEKQEEQDKTDAVKEVEVPKIVHNDNSQLKNIETPIENAEQYLDPLDNRLVRNSKNETGGKDFRRNYADQPNDMFRSYFPYMPYFPLSYDQFFQSLLANSGRNDSDNIRRRKPKRNRKNKNNQQETQDVDSDLKENIVPRPALQTVTTANPATETVTELILTKVDTTQPELKAKTMEQVLEIPMEVPHKISPAVDRLETVEEDDNKYLKKQDYKIQDYVIPELGTEHILPAIHRNGIIKDYYPVFNDDDAYLSSDEDFYVQNMDNDRYFYTTDRNFDRELSRDRRKPERVAHEDTQKPVYSRERYRHYYHKDEEEPTQRHKDSPIQRPHRITIDVKPRPYESEEVQFQTPPGLEIPDFKTKKVQKDFINSETDDEIDRFYNDFADKSSSYSDVKTPQYTRVKPSTEVERIRVPPKNSRPKPNNVETVFAHSKVAKYGQPTDDSKEENSSPVTYNDKSEYYNDGGPTYVLAKSYHDDYW